MPYMAIRVTTYTLSCGVARSHHRRRWTEDPGFFLEFTSMNRDRLGGYAVRTVVGAPSPFERSLGDGENWPSPRLLRSNRQEAGL